MSSVRTLWGELAWQLGGKKALARIEADDKKATSPGDVLRELFTEYGPCLIPTITADGARASVFGKRYSKLSSLSCSKH